MKSLVAVVILSLLLFPAHAQQAPEPPKSMADVITGRVSMLIGTCIVNREGLIARVEFLEKQLAEAEKKNQPKEDGEKQP